MVVATHQREPENVFVTAVKTINHTVTNTEGLNKILELARSIFLLIQQVWASLPPSLQSLVGFLNPVLYATHLISFGDRVFTQWICPDENGKKLWDRTSNVKIGLSLTQATCSASHSIVAIMNDFKPLWSLGTDYSLTCVGGGLLAVASICNIITHSQNLYELSSSNKEYDELYTETDLLRSTASETLHDIEVAHKAISEMVQRKTETISKAYGNAIPPEGLDKIFELSREKERLVLFGSQLKETASARNEKEEQQDQIEFAGYLTKSWNNYIQAKIDQNNSILHNRSMQCARSWIAIACSVATLVLITLGLLLPYIASAAFLTSVLVTGVATNFLELLNHTLSKAYKDQPIFPAFQALPDTIEYAALTGPS